MTASVIDFPLANSSLVSIRTYRRMNGFKLVFVGAQLNRRIPIQTHKKLLDTTKKKAAFIPPI